MKSGQKKAHLDIDLSSFESEQPIGLLVTSLAGKLEDAFFEKLTAERSFAGITRADHRVLRAVAMSGGKSFEIARSNGVTKQAVSKSIASLEERGFLVRKKLESDGRANLLVLTEKGKKLVARALEISRELDSVARRELGAEGLGQFKETLLRVEKKFGADL